MGREWEPCSGVGVASAILPLVHTSRASFGMSSVLESFCGQKLFPFLQLRETFNVSPLESSNDRGEYREGLFHS